MNELKTMVQKASMPDHFTEGTKQTIARIDEHHDVIGVMYFRNELLDFCTVPRTIAGILEIKIPFINTMIHRAVTEIDILDDAVAYRLETRKYEFMVALGPDFSSCVVQNTGKRGKKKKNNHHRQTITH